MSKPEDFPFMTGDIVAWRGKGKCARVYKYAGQRIEGIIDSFITEAGERWARITWTDASKQRFPNPLDGSIVPVRDLTLVRARS